jgi:hypothetical protein
MEFYVAKGFQTNSPSWENPQPVVALGLLKGLYHKFIFTTNIFRSLLHSTTPQTPSPNFDKKKPLSRGAID